MTRKPGGQNNAVKHGAFARDLILDDESADEFGLLWNGLFEEWAPDGTLEEARSLILRTAFGQNAVAIDFFMMS
jgi:hypothetical protein